MKSALEIRKEMKKKKPNYIRVDAHKKTKLGKKWRKPKGRHARTKLTKKNIKIRLEVGYKSPRIIRGTNKEGLKEIQISNKSQIKEIDTKKEVIIIKSTVGLKKKIEIIKEALNKGIRIINVKNPEEVIKRLKVKEKTKKTTAKKEEKKKEIKETKREETKK